jgi:protein-L-isoaspartate(D-aspartate) O-methyltransferase
MLESAISALHAGETGVDTMKIPFGLFGRAVLTGLFVFLATGPTVADTGPDDITAEAGRQMLEVIQKHTGQVRHPLVGPSISEPVIAAMGRVKRHLFVPENVRHLAYRDRPLPIGYGQTISQPFIVAFMTELLDLGPGAKVLEVGTGSGYQAAVLAEMGMRVFTIEIVPELAETAAMRFRDLGYETIESRAGDGYYGWTEAAPFDGILVTAAASHVPPSLIEQLRPGGRIVIPVGGLFRVQHLILVTKKLDGSLQTRQVLPVRFVPFTGDH